MNTSRMRVRYEQIMNPLNYCLAAAAGEAEGERHNAGRRFHVTPRDETSQRVIEALQNLYR